MGILSWFICGIIAWTLAKWTQTGKDGCSCFTNYVLRLVYCDCRGLIRLELVCGMLVSSHVFSLLVLS
ncbi:hypothetical protein HmCmsJML014_03687 [Escherichia coli]|nr:hypothetical protein HmCmsJML014_03687 [Escherichia coli]